MNNENNALKTIYVHLKRNAFVQIIFYFFAIFAGLSLPYIFNSSEPFLYTTIVLIIFFIFTIAYTLAQHYNFKYIRTYIFANAFLLSMLVYFLLSSFVVQKETRLCDNIQTVWQCYRCDSKDEMIRFYYTCELSARPLIIDSVKNEIMICIDKTAKSYYFNVYIEETGYPAQVCDMCILPRIEMLLEDINKTGYVQEIPNGKHIPMSELVFIKHVYLYFNSWMLASEHEQITKLFKDKGMTVEIRGIEYLKYRISQNK